MAISVMSITEAFNGSAARAISTVEAYPFATDNLAECAGEMGYQIMTEAADFMEIVTSTDEIIAEAAMTNPDRIDVLDENVFTKIKDGVIAFFNKIIAMVKGLIEKLKAFFYKMTGKTDKWLKIMEPKIQAAKRQTGYGDVSAERYKWDTAYITTGLPGGITKLVDSWKTKVNAVSNKSSSNAGNFTKWVNGTAGVIGPKEDAQANKGADADSQAVKDAAKAWDDITTEVNRDLEDFKKNFASTVGSSLGCSGATLDAIWAEVSKKAHGGEKTETKYGNEVDTMVNAIKNSAKTIETLKKAYEGHLKHLTTFKADLEKRGDTFDVKGEDKIPAEILRATRAAVKAEYTLEMEVTKQYESALNSARNYNTGYVQEMTTEYMNLLTKFASFKGKK